MSALLMGRAFYDAARRLAERLVVYPGAETGVTGP